MPAMLGTSGRHGQRRALADPGPAVVAARGCRAGLRCATVRGVPVISVTGATAPPAALDPDPGFDATYGYDLDALLEVAPPDDQPADLDAFWVGVKGEADAVDPAPELGEYTAFGADHEVADLTYTSLDGVRVGGWLVRPRGRVERGFVIGHGYGGREEPVVPPVTSAAAVLPVARGLPTRGLLSPMGDDTLHHVLRGIAQPRTYSHVGSTADYWIAGRVLRELVPEASSRVDYVGGSFGGGIGVFTLAYDASFTAGVLEVPSFGHHPLRLTMRCTGSGEEVRRYVPGHRAARETLRYADAAAVAARVRQPVLGLPALADPAVPPPGQFAVVNALGGPTQVHVLPAGHADYEGIAEVSAERDRQVAGFLAG